MPSAKTTAGLKVQIRTYLESLPAPAQTRMRQMRTVIRAAAPDATEGFSYRIPNFQLDGRPLVWYAAFARHTSLFPMTGDIRRALASALKGYKTSKGTVQFPLDKPLPVTLVKRLVKARLSAMRKTAAR